MGAPSPSPVLWPLSASQQHPFVPGAIYTGVALFIAPQVGPCLPAHHTHLMFIFKSVHASTAKLSLYTVSTSSVLPVHYHSYTGTAHHYITPLHKISTMPLKMITLLHAINTLLLKISTPPHKLSTFTMISVLLLYGEYKGACQNNTQSLVTKPIGGI